MALEVRKDSGTIHFYESELLNSILTLSLYDFRGHSSKTLR